jgi:hypothetical protein
MRELTTAKPHPPPTANLLHMIRDAMPSEWKGTVDESRSRVEGSVTCNGITQGRLIVTNEQKETVSLCLYFPRKTPPARRAEMSTLLGQLTRRIIVGGLDMNHINGEVRLRHTVDCDAIDPPASWFQRMIRTHIDVGIKVWPVLNQVMDGYEHRMALVMLR